MSAKKKGPGKPERTVFILMGAALVVLLVVLSLSV